MKKAFYYQYATVIGAITIVCDERAITAIEYGDVEHVGVEKIKTPLTDKAAQEIKEYLRGERKAFDVTIAPQGTLFQQNVWNKLCQIPYGETRSYSEIAIEIDNPKAVRAVGMANNHNPIAIIIPCHRVIGKNGRLVGYSGGLELKIALLTLEMKYK